MSSRVLFYFIDVLVMGGALYFFIALSWSKILLGTAMTFIAAFLPTLSISKTSANETIDLGVKFPAIPAILKSPIVLRLKGPLRILVCVSGVLLILSDVVSAGLETYGHVTERGNSQAAKVSDYEPADLGPEQRLAELSEIREEIMKIEAETGRSLATILLLSETENEILRVKELVRVKELDRPQEKIIDEIRRQLDEADPVDVPETTQQSAVVPVPSSGCYVSKSPVYLCEQPDIHVLAQAPLGGRYVT